jgi:LysM repeat protein
MAPKSQASRWLAPLALILAALVTALILASGGGSSSGSDSLAPAADSTTATTVKTGGPRYYTVRSGDTLTSISLDTGVSVEQLEQLNPGLDTQALQPGQRLRLRS